MENLNPSRTIAARLLTAALHFAIAASTWAGVHYVDLNSANPTPPYSSWATAATNIQNAVDAAVAGDEIVVTNGIYVPIAVGKPLMLRSVNGPQFTIIDGRHANRCSHLSRGGFALGGDLRP